jgi:hypothetical protein
MKKTRTTFTVLHINTTMNPNSSHFAVEEYLPKTIVTEPQQLLSMADETQPSSGPATSQLDRFTDFGPVTPTFEPLKVCLDDDSSIEDGDEDMFDDDAFYFGDEDFQALLSRVPAKTPVSPSRIMTSSLPTQPNLPLHHNVAQTTDSIGSPEPHCIDSAASSTTGGLTSSGPSSTGEASCCVFSERYLMLCATMTIAFACRRII